MTRLAGTVDDFCAEIGIGRTSAYALAKAGKLRILKIGRRSIITDEDKRAFLDSLPSITAPPPATERKRRGAGRVPRSP